MKILYETQTGSRLYGTNTPKSDTDIKKVILPDLEDLILGRKICNIATSTSTKEEKNSADDIDQELIPLQVLVRDFIEGQTYAIELVFSAISKTQQASQKVYDENLLQFFDVLAQNFLTCNVKPMIGYALNQAAKYGVKGSRLKVALEFRDFVEQGVTSGRFGLDDRFLVQDMMPFVSRYDGMKESKYIFIDSYEHLNERAPALFVLDKLYPFNTIRYSEVLKRANATVAQYGKRAERAKESDGIDWKASSHALRITRQARKLLDAGHLDFPYDKETIDLVLYYKEGKGTLEEFKKDLETELELLEYSQANSTLPQLTDALREECDEFLKTWLMGIFYGLSKNRPRLEI